MKLELNIVHPGETENKKHLCVGNKVEYLEHLPGGMVKIKLFDGSEDVAHPYCFKELQ